MDLLCVCVCKKHSPESVDETKGKYATGRAGPGQIYRKRLSEQNHVSTIFFYSVIHWEMAQWKYNTNSRINNLREQCSRQQYKTNTEPRGTEEKERAEQRIIQTMAKDEKNIQTNNNKMEFYFIQRFTVDAFAVRKSCILLSSCCCLLFFFLANAKIKINFKLFCHPCAADACVVHAKRMVTACVCIKIKYRSTEHRAERQLVAVAWWLLAFVPLYWLQCDHTFSSDTQ